MTYRCTGNLQYLTFRQVFPFPAEIPVARQLPFLFLGRATGFFYSFGFTSSTGPPAFFQAYHVPRGMLEFWIDPNGPYPKERFQSGKKFIFMCAGGLRSALAGLAAHTSG